VQDHSIWDMFAERFNKMPVLLRVFVVLGTVAGMIVGIVMVGKMLPENVRPIRFILFWVGGLSCAGFFVGLVVGCFAEVIVKAMYKEEKKKKKKKRRRDDDEEYRY
jgi:fructose-specific phosphotransferase system IIC component